MRVAIAETEIEGVLIVAPEVFEDQRGFFQEVYRSDEYTKQGLPAGFVQLNHSGSIKNTVRGLHFQWQPAMGKLMRVTRGTAFLVAVDIRQNSPTLGRWFGMTLSESDRKLIWAPASFARGFAVLSDFAEIEYLTTAVYNADAESAIAWNDPAINIAWPISHPILSAKDAKAQSLSEWLTRPEAAQFQYERKAAR